MAFPVRSIPVYLADQSFRKFPATKRHQAPGPRHISCILMPINNRSGFFTMDEPAKDGHVLYALERKFWFEKTPRTFTFTRRMYDELVSKILADTALAAEIARWHEIALDLVQDGAFGPHHRKTYLTELLGMLPYRDDGVRKAMAKRILPMIEDGVLRATGFYDRSRDEAC